MPDPSGVYAFKKLFVANPAPAAGVSFGPPPAGKMWKIHSFRTIFQADATVANRILALGITASGDPADTWSCGVGQVCVASQLIEVSGGIGHPGQINITNVSPLEELTSIVQVGLPDVWLSGTMFFSILGTGIGAADQFSGIGALIEEVAW